VILIYLLNSLYSTAQLNTKDPNTSEYQVRRTKPHSQGSTHIALCVLTLYHVPCILCYRCQYSRVSFIGQDFLHLKYFCHCNASNNHIYCKYIVQKRTNLGEESTIFRILLIDTINFVITTGAIESTIFYQSIVN
jgi:hypothetical protein